MGETAVGRDILLDRCNPEFDARRKERAHRFKPGASNCTEEDDEEDGDGNGHGHELEHDSPNEPNIEANPNPPTNNRYSKVDFNPFDRKHRDYVKSQLHKHGLGFIHHYILQMGDVHSLAAQKIIWKLTRSLIKQPSFVTDQVKIPNYDDVSLPMQWRHCADRRRELFSTKTDLPKNQFYVPSPLCDSSDEESMFDCGDDQEAAISPVHSINCDTVDDLLMMIQLFLAFHSFYKYGCGLFGITGFEEIDLKVQDMLRKLQSSVNRGEGTLGWCLSKFHDLLHMTVDMKLFGSSENPDTSKGEHGLKIWAKLPAKTALATHGADKFIEQLSLRLYEQNLLDKANSLLVPSKIPTKDGRGPLEHPLFVVDRIKEESFQCNGKYKRRKDQNLVMDITVQHWLCSEQTIIQKESVVVYSQLYLEEHDLLFRSTPNHRNSGAWYDWVLVDYLDSSDEHIQYPFKILGFLDNDDGSGPICYGCMCASQSVVEKQRSKLGIFEHWHLELRAGTRDLVYRFVDINTISRACLVIQLTKNSQLDNSNSALDDDGSEFGDQNGTFTNKIIVVKDRKTEWPRLFLTGMNRVNNRKRNRNT